MNVIARGWMICYGMLALGAVAAAPLATSSGIVADEAHTDRISEDERAGIWRAINAGRSRLALPKAGTRPTFRWPLQPARGYHSPVPSRVSFHVDHDPTFPSLLRDYNCGTRTYDLASGYNHRGTDISMVPDSWNLMDAGQMEIVAAAAGTIVHKADGHFDRNCQFGNAPWNAVYVEHDDGSIAWYGHMKTGSTTAKGVGERVAAGEYLGLVGSSGSSSGPHLHLEVYDAAGQLIDPFAGSCNAKNSDSWWESQPAYQATQVMAVTTASAAPVSPVCGADGRNSSTGTYNRKTAFARGDALWLVVNVRDLALGMRVGYTLRDPSGAVFSSFEGAAATQNFAGAVAWASATIPATAPLGAWMAEVRLGESRVEVPFTVSADGGPLAHYTDLWWNPAESGWGVNLNHQGDALFATWFTYDADGTGLWLVIPSAPRQPDGSFAGTIYRTTGTPFAQINGAPAADPTPAVMGTGTLRFTDADNATFSYTVGGAAQVKSLVRQRFATPYACMPTRGSRASSTSYQDLWWNEAESGWGINLTHQGDTIFATWFTYGFGGRGTWLVAPETTRRATGEYRGRLFRTQGIAFDRIAGAPALQGAQDVGEITLTFADGERGRLDYTLDGVTQSKAITRQVFGAGAPLCR